MTKGQRLNHDFTKGDFRLYDVNGKQTYREDSDGYWHKYEYDTNGNQTYSENSNGFWYKCEYDTNYNEIYSEDSNNLIRHSIW